MRNLDDVDMNYFIIIVVRFLDTFSLKWFFSKCNKNFTLSTNSFCVRLFRYIWSSYFLLSFLCEIINFINHLRRIFEVISLLSFMRNFYPRFFFLSIDLFSYLESILKLVDINYLCITFFVEFVYKFTVKIRYI